jgi:hypothetical protein
VEGVVGKELERIRELEIWMRDRLLVVEIVQEQRKHHSRRCLLVPARSMLIVRPQSAQRHSRDSKAQNTIARSTHMTS